MVGLIRPVLDGDTRQFLGLAAPAASLCSTRCFAVVSSHTDPAVMAKE